MSILTINRNDKIIEEFAEFVVKMIKEGAGFDTKNEQEIIKLFKSYINQYYF